MALRRLKRLIDDAVNGRLKRQNLFAYRDSLFQKYVASVMVARCETEISHDGQFRSGSSPPFLHRDSRYEGSALCRSVKY